jgi:hypothetical protein
MDMRFGTQNITSLYRTGPLITVLEEQSKYKLDLVRVQEVRWDRRGTKPAGKHIFFNGKGNENHKLGFFVHKKVISAVMAVEFVSDRVPYIILRGYWCDIIAVNVHAPKEDKINDVKDSFYKELECESDKFSKYHKKIMLKNFSAKV